MSRRVFQIMLFWAIYIMDRNISFRLGHAPAIQDYDVDTPMMIENDKCPSSIIELMTFWVDCGRVQGRICTQLYGPAASSLTPEDRARIAESLADELERIHQRKSKVWASPYVLVLAFLDLLYLGKLGDDVRVHSCTRHEACWPMDLWRRYHAFQHTVSHAEVASSDSRD